MERFGYTYEQAKKADPELLRLLSIEQRGTRQREVTGDG